MVCYFVDLIEIEFVVYYMNYYFCLFIVVGYLFRFELFNFVFVGLDLIMVCDIMIGGFFVI